MSFYLLIQYEPERLVNTANSMNSMTVLLTSFNEIFGVTLEIMGSRGGISFDNAGLNLSYLIQEEKETDARVVGIEIIEKLNLLASIQLKHKISPFVYKSLQPMWKITNINSMQGLFQGIEPKLVQHFLLDKQFEEFRVLIEAFEDLKNKRIFDAFPKLVNWLDYYDYGEEENKPQFKFCILRTALSHTGLNNANKVKKMYPRIKLSGNIFIRDKHNELILYNLIPELLEIVKKRFRIILEGFVA